MTIPIYAIVFYFFSALVIGSALMVITSRNPVKAVLFLVLAFFASAVLWMLMQAEFLSLVLIFVYVGAVMTLFLFVVMMLNVDIESMKENFVRYLPYGVLVMVLLVGAILLVIGPKHLSSGALMPVHHPASYNNIKVLGMLLFTKYVYAFEIAGAILLVAMVAAISLAFHGRRSDTKSQRISEQLQANKKDRLRIIKMESDQP